MSRKRFHGILTAVLFFLLCTFNVSANVSAAAESEPPPYAELLFELDTNTILHGYNEDISLPVGVMNKLMTVLVAAEAVKAGEIKLSDVVPTPSDAMIKGASVWLEPGDEITVDELFRAVIIGNANDATVTLKSAVTNNENDFIKRVDKISSTLSLTSTSFTNEHGYLDPAMQISSASDLSKLVTALSEYDFLAETFKTKLDYIRDGKAQLVNSNRLVKHDGAIGYKFGYSKETGYCLAAATEINGSRYGVVLLGFEDEDKMYARARTLLDYGFESYVSITPEIPETLPESITVKGALVDSVPIIASNPNKIIIHKADAGNLEAIICLPDYIYAPVNKDDTIGEIHYYLNGSVIYKFPLTASVDIPKLKLRNILVIIMEMMWKYG
jgi:D-alanyl-D-alanine carboxypeptidase (penicillin-binding protein 5/6)